MSDRASTERPVTPATHQRPDLPVPEVPMIGAMCRGCGQMLPPDAFRLDRNATARFGLSYRCADCKRKSYVQWADRVGARGRRKAKP